MDISKILSLMSNKSFEDNVSSQNDMLPMLLKMMQTGGQMDNDQMLGLLAKNNPQMQTLLPLMKLMNQNKSKQTPKTRTKFDYVKIKDYHNL